MTNYGRITTKLAIFLLFLQKWIQLEVREEREGNSDIFQGWCLDRISVSCLVMNESVNRITNNRRIVFYKFLELSKKLGENSSQSQNGTSENTMHWPIFFSLPPKCVNTAEVVRFVTPTSFQNIVSRLHAIASISRTRLLVPTVSSVNFSTFITIDSLEASYTLRHAIECIMRTEIFTN